MEDFNYVVYGSILILLLLVVIVLVVFQRKIFLFLLTNFSDTSVKTRVLEVLEGDTIIVEIPKEEKNKFSTSINSDNETTWTVRLIGIDTPESRASLYIDEAPFGKESLEYVEERFKKNKNIILVFDEQLYDKFEKHLAYIYLPSGECLNKTLLKEGYAWTRNHAFTIKLEKHFEKAQEQAKTKQKGVWSMYVTRGILKEEYKNSEHYKEYRQRVEENE